MMLDPLFKKGKLAKKLKRGVYGVFKDDGDETEIVVHPFINICTTTARLNCSVATVGSLPWE